jgi:hypothetical protein
MDISVYLSRNKDMRLDQLEYYQIIKNLMYVINYMRSNIAYSVSKLSRFTSNLSMDYWKIINRVLKYLRYALEYKLHYTSYLTMLERYSDVNWIYDTKNSKLTSEYVFTLNK